MMAPSINGTKPVISSTRFVATIFQKSTGNDAPELSDTCLAATRSFLRSLFPKASTSFRSLADHVSEATVLVASPLDLVALRQDNAQAILDFEREWNVELVFQKEGAFRKHKRLAVFDMDSTLIQQEVIDEIARKIGVEEQVSAITARAMNGELDFTASLKERVALLKGVPATVFVELRDVITLTPGAKDLIKALKRLGYKTAVLSGGFTPLTGWLAQQLGLDYSYANHLVVSDDGARLTGEVTGEIVNAEKKREHVLAIAEKEGILLEQSLVVGDGANDLPMMGVAGLGVAFNAKSKVQLAAPARLNSGSLMDVLYLLGFTREEQEQLISES
ncbi:phosphoserine phosphatase SerB [Verruconis gallopava]|uniref:phosphoserine phosphatase n=1 Tax=Verruconis gallopava TaxID=253628 RepID=A0A0D1YLI5_9PEZI|nr:phosphoserine phosphatase SerB [Verruconis gallopava]KIW01697.1 phosphoserine phosphatase SerB [Verruconis gallopava]